MEVSKEANPDNGVDKPQSCLCVKLYICLHNSTFVQNLVTLSKELFKY